MPSISAKKTKSKLVEIAPGLLSQVDDGMDDSFDVDEEDLDDTSGDEGAEWPAWVSLAVPASSDSSSDSDSDEDMGDEDDIDKIFSGKRGKFDMGRRSGRLYQRMDELVDDSDLVMGSGKKFERTSCSKLSITVTLAIIGQLVSCRPCSPASLLCLPSIPHQKPAPKGKKEKTEGRPQGSASAMETTV